MKRSTLLALVGTQTALMVAFGWTAAVLGRDEFRLVSAPERADAAPRAAAPDAPGTPPVVRIAVAALPIVGIESVEGDAGPGTDPAAAADLIATVIDTQPLVDLQARWRAAKAEADAAQAAAAASARDRSRVQALYDDDRNASQRALDTAAAQSLADAARARGSVAALEALRATARTAWGAPLQASLLADGRAEPRLAALLAGREVLLRVTLRPDDAAPAPSGVVLRSSAGHASVVAQLVSTVPPGALGSDASSSGRASLYRAPGRGLSPGMRLSVAPVGRAGGAAGPAGVSVPATAIVWYAGQPWVYERLSAANQAPGGLADADDGGAADDDAKVDAAAVKGTAATADMARDADAAPRAAVAGASGGATAGRTGAAATDAPSRGSPASGAAGERVPMARFQRHAVADGERQGARWFLPGVDAHAAIVARGAQVLLSEELRSLSHDDDD